MREFFLGENMPIVAVFKLDGTFTLRETCLFSNWAQSRRWFAAVNFDEKEQKECLQRDAIECFTFHVRPGYAAHVHVEREKRAIWTHPDWNLRYHWDDVSFLNEVPELQFTEEIFQDIARKAWGTLQKVPKKCLTPKVLWIGIQQGLTPLNASWIRQETVTQEMADEVFEKDWMEFSNIPARFKTDIMKERFEEAWEAFSRQSV